MIRATRQGVNIYIYTIYYSKTLNNRTGGANNEYRGGPGGPGNGFGGPGGGFSGNRSSGKPLLLLRLKKTPPGPPKPPPGPPKL